MTGNLLPFALNLAMGFDPSTGEWLPGHEEARDLWEKQYADAQKRFEAHQEQITRMQAADAEAAVPTSYTSDANTAEGEPAEDGAPAAPRPAPATTGGTLASDEALHALREKLSGGQ